MSEPVLTRGLVFTLDPSPAQERLLRSYCGAARFAYNWAIGEVSDNLTVRRTERDAGVAEDRLTSAISWSAYSLNKAWNAAKSETAPWWREVSMHAFRSGVTAASQALANFSESKNGTRAGRRVGFPRYKFRRRATPSVTFTENNHQLSWLADDRHGVRLMLPQSSPDAEVRWRSSHLAFIHTVESTRRLYRLVETGRARIQKLTISYRGGRWQAAFLVRYLATAPTAAARASVAGKVVGLDAGIRHLVTLSEPLAGLTDAEGHVANPRVLESQLRALRKLDRAVARSERGSKNRSRLLRRRARLHGRIAKTRALELHRVTNELVRAFETVASEDLNVAGMGRRKGRLGRALASASLGELRRQLAYKTDERQGMLVVVDRFYPSSKTCSGCGAVKAKLDRSELVFVCEHCRLDIDRDVNAAINIAREAIRLQADQGNTVAGLRPETLNADPRSRQTTKAPAAVAAVA
jgi:putative transposase